MHVNYVHRQNLDPFGEYSDSDLWQALYKAHIGDAIASLPAGLDFLCDASTFSLGQQQLLCLSRYAELYLCIYILIVYVEQFCVAAK